ncbi:MAG: Helix-turn-helix domain [Candidatus Parcubacteria bacterium]|jgi:excisionase family DNA binding protein
MTSSHIVDEFLTLKEAGKLIGVHHETIRRWHLREGLKTYKFKKTLRVRKEDLLHFLEANKK